MRKKLKSVMSMFLVLVMLCSLIGCGSTGKDVSKKFKSSGSNIVEDGKSDYVIVIPEGNDYATNVAASELNTFLELSSGVTLKIVVDSDLEEVEDKKYISLGETTLLESAGIALTKEELGESGYIIKTIDDNLYIAGVTDATYHGTIYGVYEWLEPTIGYHFYAADEFVYEEMDTIPLYEFDEQYRPSIDVREIGFKDVSSDALYAWRVKSFDSSQTVWNTFAHTMITVYLPYATYGAEHPDWYTPGGDQLCLSSEGALQEIISRVQSGLDSSPNKPYVMIGREDNSTICTCEKCAETMKKYGGNYSGVELEFTNKIAEAVDEYVAQNYPDRVVKYFFFAYGPTLNAPTVYDEESKTYKPIYEDTKIHEDVGVMIAPIGMDFAKEPTHQVNESSYNAMKAWSDLLGKKNITIWNYCANFTSYMFNCNNFGIVQEYYRFYEDIGTVAIFDQGYWNANAPGFSAMRIYCQAELGWDSTQNYEDLAMEFIEQYYGDGAEAIKKYYHFIRGYYKHLDVNDNSTGMIYYLLDDKNLWPLETVQTIMSYMDEALEAIEPLKETNPERYETLYNRIQRERLSPLYMMLKFYIGQLSDEEKTSYIADFEKYSTMFGVTNTGEFYYNDVTGYIDGWKKS